VNCTSVEKLTIKELFDIVGVRYFETLGDSKYITWKALIIFVILVGTKPRMARA
jgi:hypothetical protein